MTATAFRFDRSAILKAAWVKARPYIASGVARFTALKVALRDAWAEAKEPREPVTYKTIVRALDRAAGRASRPATSKQCSFLASLMLKAGEDASEYLLGSAITLSGRDASSMIGFYLGKR